MVIYKISDISIRNKQTYNVQPPHKKNFIVSLAKKRHDANDKTTKCFFNPNENETKYGKQLISEPTRRGKRNVITTIKFTPNIKFDSFDKIVFDSCVSQFVEGYNAASLRMIHRLITGKIENKYTNLSPTVMNDIFNSINKLTTTDILIDATDVCAALGYNNSEPFKRKNKILPAEIINAQICNNDSTVLSFTGLPPLYELATLRHRRKKSGGQILSYPVDLLDVPNTKNSIVEIKIKNHTLRRILECNHSELSNHVRFDEIILSTGINIITKWQMQDLRNYIESLLNYWQQKNLFSQYEFLKKDRKYYGFAIHF